jgi:hypothetical protein
MTKARDSGAPPPVTCSFKQFGQGRRVLHPVRPGRERLKPHFTWAMLALLGRRRPMMTSRSSKIRGRHLCLVLNTLIVFLCYQEIAASQERIESVPQGISVLDE